MGCEQPLSHGAGYSDAFLSGVFVQPFLFFVGFSISHRAAVKKGVRLSAKTPVKFSFSYWWNNNVIPILLYAASLYVWILFADQMLQLFIGDNAESSKLAWFWELLLGGKAFMSLLIGFFYQYLGYNGIQNLIKKIGLLIGKITGNGSK